MITIGICDDDPVSSDKLYQIINRIMFPLEDWNLCLFRNGKEVIDAIDAGTFDCQLLFMDIMLDGGLGIQTAQYICSHSLNTDLIFVTASRDHVFECYHYHAFAYLLKPITESDIVLEMQRYLEECQDSPKYLTIVFQGITHQIPISSILYIESNLRKLTIHTQKADYYCYQKLNDIAETLKYDGFVRCHQSYLIALDKVTRHTPTRLYIEDTAIPISSRYQTKLKKILADGALASSHNELSASLAMAQKEYGALICIRGPYLGSIIRIKPEQKILIGRDGTAVDIVINLPFVSRMHCSILYHHTTMEYELRDFSNNGTFVHKDKRLLQDETYLLKPGSEICFGDKENVYKLG